MNFKKLLTSIPLCSLSPLLQPVTTSALEPLGGWHGNNINQSTIALEWLYYQDHLLGGMGRVRHVHNGGKVQVLTSAESYYVDGFDEENNTV